MGNKNSNEVLKFNKTTMLHSALAIYVATTIVVIIAGIVCYQNDMKKGSLLINVGFVMSTLLSLGYVLFGSMQKILEKESESQKVDVMNGKLDIIIKDINSFKEQKQEQVSKN